MVEKHAQCKIVSGPYLDFWGPYATLLSEALRNIIFWAPMQHYCFEVPTVSLLNIIVDNIITKIILFLPY